MGWLRRREAPPQEVVAALPREDRVLSWADVDPAGGGGVVVASTLGLWWPGPDGPRCIGWQFVDKAVWRDGVLSVDEAEVVDDVLLVDRPTVSVRLTVARDLPPTIRKRVEANVLRSQVYPLPGGAGRFVARRVPGQDGVTWRVRLEPGTSDGPSVRAAIEQRLQELRG
ncbi:MAG TPA: hypothetical protein VGN35_01105 [Jatrophihabitantaceae bacterium]|jgi:hypothetical protein|nr:hypothetical protein [Jatrophihabitantaceae bacterium]